MLLGFLTALITVITVPSMVQADSRDHERSPRKGDFGMLMEKLLNRKSEKYFGVEKPLKNSAPKVDVPYRSEDQEAGEQLLSAHGLKIEYLTRIVGNKADQMAFYPMENPTHIIACIEGGREVIGSNADGSDKYNPSLQNIDLVTGEVTVILRGMNRCDGIRTTPWGTILATEETNDGGAYEILNPLNVLEQSVISRTTGETTDPSRVAQRISLPTMAWEGLTVLPSGVVIGGDELRPGSGVQDSDGGSIFKFIPDNPHSGGNISGIDESPLASGSVYAMQISCREVTSSRFPQYGQGCETGHGNWVWVNAGQARSDANAAGATGYYRPEDLHTDTMFYDAGNPNAVRFCWTNTGREKAANYGEVMCAVDENPIDSKSLVIASRFVEGDGDFNSFDNLAFQPVTGNLYVIEDHPNGDVFGCLPDGADRNIKSDGCIKVLSVKDSSAEPTGFIFSPDGKTAYVNIQHSNDGLMPMYDDYPTDDLLKITGFEVKHSRD
ncbi:MAG: alkaline phosphatase PhoX [Nitrospinota bacterium]